MLELPNNQVSSRRSRLRYVVPVLVAVPFLAVAAVLVFVASSHPSIRVGKTTLAEITLPRGGGTITRVVAIGGREQQVVPVRLDGRQVVPVKRLPAGERITIQATIRRPSWIGWLTGKNRAGAGQRDHASGKARLDLPDTQARTAGNRRLQRSGGGGRIRPASARPLPPDTFRRRRRASPSTSRPALARETSRLPPARGRCPPSRQISWFPAGTKATAVATPAPGTRITPDTKITLTFSKPVRKVLGRNLPPVTPRKAGAWHEINSHTIQFVPQGYGYGLGADVRVSLPEGINLMGGQARGSDPIGQWTVPDGSPLALQQLLAGLGYLPVKFHPSTGGNDVANTPAAEESAIVNPPHGTFSWRYPSTPALLKSLWSPNSYTELTKGAVMAFEDAQGLPTDGVAGPDVWKALINAAVQAKTSTFGYTFVMVSETLPENIQVWHNGKIVEHGAVNTGISAAPTATGTFAVYEHIPVGTMSGQEPRRQHVPRPWDPLDQLLQRWRRPARLHSRLLRVPTESWLRGDAFLRSRPGLPVHPDRDDRQRRSLSLAMVQKGVRARRRIMCRA